ncbi:hypothetical protein BsWGS_12279 [Bradybaena similaris]
MSLLTVKRKDVLESASRSSVLRGKSQIPLAVPRDTWNDPPDPAKKAVCIGSECEDGVQIIADLLKYFSTDPYNEDEAELQYLFSKPSCFLILGKPGVGKTSLAKRFAAEWKCQIINSTDIILENISLQTEMGQQCTDILVRGGAVPDNLVLSMMENKLNSSEVAHHGYVMDDYPCLSEDLMSLPDQLEFIKNLKIKPDFIVNLRIPEKDIEYRRLNQLIDPFTGTIYTKEVHTPDKHKTSLPPEENQEDKIVSDEEEEDAEMEETIDEKKSITELPAAILARLLKRPEDTPQQVEANLAKFRNNMLRILEDYMGDHDQQYLVELDGNLPLAVIFKQLLQKLQTFVLRPAAVVTRLTDPEEDDLSDDMETDEIMRVLCPKLMVAPRYRWRRSRWLRNCPVALFEGNVTPGKPEYAVSFLDKVYCLSSEEAVEKFMRNPRPYLVPKMPRTACKISVVGQPFTGKTTLCHLLANYYGAQVFDIHKLATDIKMVDRLKEVEKVKIEATANAISEVKGRIKAVLIAEALERRKEKQARLAAEAEALRMLQENMEHFEDEEESWEDKKDKKESKSSALKINEEDTLEIVDELNEDAPVDENAAELKEKTSGLQTPAKEEKEKEDLGEEEEKQQIEEVEEETDKGISEIADPSAAAVDGEIPVSEVDSLMAIPEPEVDETHPEVKAIVNVAVALAEIAPIKLEPEFEAEVLVNTIEAWEKELRSTRHDGPLHGCWILDNFPETPDLWNACLERSMIPDAVYVLGEEIKGVDIDKLRTTCERFCLKNRDAIFAEMNRRVLEKDLKNQEARLDAERKRILEEEQMKKEMEEEMQRQMILEEEARVAEEARQATLERDDRDATTADTIPADDEPGLATPVQVPSTVLDDDARLAEDEEDKEAEEFEVDVIPDKTELELMLEQPEAKAFMEKILYFEENMSRLIAVISSTSPVVAFRLSSEDSTLEDMLDAVVKNEEKQFKYVAWEYGQADQEEEEEDLEAEGLDTETVADGKEEAEEEEEDITRGIKKALGDTNFFDPVSLKEMNVLYPGNPEIAAMYREKCYYFSSAENRDTFIDEPTQFLSLEKPPQAPPIRLLILGPRGSGKTTNGTYLAEKLGIFHICYRERLQEMIIAKTKKKIGPGFEEEIEESLLEESESQQESTTGKLDAAGGEKGSRQPSTQGITNVNEEETEESSEGDENTPEEEEYRMRDSEDIDNSQESKTSVTHEGDTTGIKVAPSKGPEIFVDYDTEDAIFRGSPKQAGLHVLLLFLFVELFHEVIDVAYAIIAQTNNVV